MMELTLMIEMIVATPNFLKCFEGLAHGTGSKIFDNCFYCYYTIAIEASLNTGQYCIIRLITLRCIFLEQIHC